MRLARSSTPDGLCRWPCRSRRGPLRGRPAKGSAFPLGWPPGELRPSSAPPAHRWHPVPPAFARLRRAGPCWTRILLHGAGAFGARDTRIPPAPLCRWSKPGSKCFRASPGEGHLGRPAHVAASSLQNTTPAMASTIRVIQRRFSLQVNFMDGLHYISHAGVSAFRRRLIRRVAGGRLERAGGPHHVPT